MQIARVVGTATSTIKHSSMHGQKLLMVVQPLMADGVTPDADPQIACGCRRSRSRRESRHHQ
ncbi:MAG: EutN/CcmL family microcompartment protein [Pirellulales bacterium]